MRKILSIESLQVMKKMYVEDMMSTTAIGNHFNLSDNTVATRLRELGVNVTKKRSKKIKHPDYFEIINTAKKAYFLGLIVADGSVVLHNNKYTFRIELISSDDYLIRELILELGGNLSDLHQSVRAGRNPTSYFSFSDKIFTDNLAKYGVVPNKTYTAYFPDIPKEYYRDFIRGYFDGDGTVYMNKHLVRAAFYGNRLIVESIKQFLMEDIALSNVGIVNRGKHTSIHLGSQKVLLNFFNLYYKDSDIYMTRKHNLLAALAGNG